MGHEPCRPKREQAPTDVAGSCTLAAASCSTVGCGSAASADAGTGSCALAFAAAVISPAGSNCGRVSCCTGGACTSGCGSPCSRHTSSQHQHVRQNDQRTPLPACCNPTPGNLWKALRPSLRQSLVLLERIPGSGESMDGPRPQGFCQFPAGLSAAHPGLQAAPLTAPGRAPKTAVEGPATPEHTSVCQMKSAPDEWAETSECDFKPLPDHAVLGGQIRGPSQLAFLAQLLTSFLATRKCPADSSW